MTAPSAPVLVVGGGPVGLTVANLLAAREVPVVLLERHASTSDEAKAISLDDESLRALAAADLAEKVFDIVVPGTGTRYYDRHGRVLFHARGPQGHRLGYPFKNQFAQPELERVLLDSLTSRPRADVRLATELASLAERPDRVRVTVRPTGQDTTIELDVSWVLGCDGGRSRVRELCGIDMAGVSHQELWLVVDTVGDPHDQRYVMHYGTPRRPTVVVPGRDGRCRYEFLLHPGEGDKHTTPDFTSIRRLIAPYREVTADQVERATTYTFNALIADRWRDGRCLLLGDAAHMMPPFAGQGLNSGIRDAANLAWKVADVWHGRTGDQLLDTYEQERRPHAAAMVRFSERLGEIVMTTDTRRAMARDIATRTLLHTPLGRRYLTQMRFRPPSRHRRGLVVGSHPLVGTQLPQPRVLLAPTLRTCLLDDALGNDWALLGVDVVDADWRGFGTAAWRDLPCTIRTVDVVLGDRLPRPVAPRIALADADGQLEAALGSARGRFVLVRPDHYIAAVVRRHEIPELAAGLQQALAVPRRRLRPSTERSTRSSAQAPQHF